MPPTHETVILQEAKELKRLADALETECATWVQYDISDRPRFPSRAYTERQEEEKNRARYLWDNAAAAGAILLKLLDVGAFDQEKRIKNAIFQMRAEMNRARRDNTAPTFNPGRKRPACPGSQPWSEVAHEMFLVKTLEGFCKLWAKSYADHTSFISYYVPIRDKAALQTKMLRSLSQKLKEKHAPLSVQQNAERGTTP